uniref:Uncharacterized protein n=1 Tax=Rhizophora mucronata TaxID=61149 RepID=A0A2P2IV50_RHIMU
MVTYQVMTKKLATEFLETSSSSSSIPQSHSKIIIFNPKERPCKFEQVIPILWIACQLLTESNLSICYQVNTALTTWVIRCSMQF